MDFITDEIAIGNWVDAEEIPSRRERGIRSMISLNGQMAGRTARALGVEALGSFLLADGPGNPVEVFDEALLTLVRFTKECPKVLVHCHMGLSRSPVLVAAYLVLTRGMHPEDAFGFIAARRLICPSAGITDLIIRSPVLRAALRSGPGQPPQGE